jgi:DNA-binding transcriptional LysR family regulator
MNEQYNPLTPELCRTFVTLAGLDGSVTKTARELGLNEASVSKRIRPLVHGAAPHMPRPWLEKNGKRFFLTDEGRAMLPAATEQAQRWRQFTAFAAAGRMPGLTVACGQEAAGGVLLQAATAFRKSHPQAVLRIAVVRGRRRIEGVANGLYDLAVVTLAPVAVREIARREVVIATLSDDELMLACAAKSPWAQHFVNAARPLPVAEFIDWPLVLPEADSPIRKQWDERVGRQESDKPPQVVLEIGGWHVLLGYVLAGFGVGLLPRSVVAGAGAKLRARPLPEILRPANRLYTVQLPKPANANLVSVFLDALTATTRAG